MEAGDRIRYEECGCLFICRVLENRSDDEFRAYFLLVEEVLREGLWPTPVGTTFEFSERIGYAGIVARTEVIS